jgi:hypothetical protein
MRIVGWVGVVIPVLFGACGDSEGGSSKHVGEPCTTGDESKPAFRGFGVEEVSVEGVNPACGRGVCLVNHFQGRVSCPYGQADVTNPTCFVPKTSDPVAVPVAPQMTTRRADLAVTCSCRCDGPDDGPFCRCPSGTECRPIVPDIGFPEGKSIAGSYCVDPGAVYTGIVGPECDPALENCGPP